MPFDSTMDFVLQLGSQGIDQGYIWTDDKKDILRKPCPVLYLAEQN